MLLLLPLPKRKTTSILYLLLYVLYNLNIRQVYVCGFAFVLAASSRLKFDNSIVEVAHRIEYVLGSVCSALLPYVD